MDFVDTHDFETRNMTVVEPEGKLLKCPTGAFIVEIKNGVMLFEYTVDYKYEEFDEENNCSYCNGEVAYGIIENEDVEFVDEKKFRSYATGPDGVKHDVWRAVATNMLWFSRHDFTKTQADEIVKIYGPVIINKVSKTIQTAYELQKEVSENDIIGIVAPVNLQEQFLKIAAGKPVISCRNKRVVVKNSDGGEDKVEFVFDGWYQIDEIRVVTHDL